MRAAVLTSYDAPPVASEFDEPDAIAGCSLVDVSAAGINPIDLVTAAGKLPEKPPLPSIAGREGVGTIGGRRVYFDLSAPPFGSLAERTVVPDERVIDVPDGVSDELAVCFGIAGLAAWLGLDWRGGLTAGETVLVLGASGVVGRIAVQAARLLGARRVVAAARSVDELADLGADAVVDLRDTDDLADRFRAAAEGPLDLVLDPIWGEAAVASLSALRPRGRMVQIGNASGVATSMPAGVLRTGAKSLLGHANFAAPQEAKAEAFQTMCRHGAAGELSVPVELVPLDAVADAWERQAGGPHRKLVLLP